MNPLSLLMRFDACVGVILDHSQSLALLAARLYVSWVFLVSGYLKWSAWESTLSLFEEEYRVPLLTPPVAAVLGTAGELLFPVLLIVGWLSRLGALGLTGVNVLAVVSYYHVLGGEGFEAALGQHWLWGVLIAAAAVFGPGKISMDHWLNRAMRAT